MIIKVCGMREPENIRAVEELGVDWIGLIFFPPSPRNVVSIPDSLSKQSQRVGVFVDADVEDIIQKVNMFHLDMIQLHGQESPHFCHVLKQRIPAHLKIIKMIPIATQDDILLTHSYSNDISYFLFESKVPTQGNAYGGSGQKFDWNILKLYQGYIPFLLTGGIDENDAERMSQFHHPQFVGIDLNSRFESSPAIKDISKLHSFIAKVRNLT